MMGKNNYQDWGKEGTTLKVNNILVEVERVLGFLAAVKLNGLNRVGDSFAKCLFLRNNFK